MKTAKRTDWKTKALLSTEIIHLPHYDSCKSTNGVLLAEPSIAGRIRTSSGKEFLRVKFRVWPGRGTVIETGLRSELLGVIKQIVPE
jgi:hypothetical protein